MQLNNKSATVLFSLIGDLEYRDRKEAGLDDLWMELNQYFQHINALGVIYAVKGHRNINVDFKLLERELRDKYDK